jgi:NF-kappa-B inhibitor-like protein 2
MLCQCEDSIVTTNSYDYAKRKQLFEKLGDGSCKLKNFVKAIEFYTKALEAAQLNGESEQQLIPIYVSLYQTYTDNKQYSEAIEFMKKEYELIKDEPKEAAVTLMGLGNLLDLAGKSFWESEATFKKALDEARKAEDLSLEKDVMQKFSKFCRKNSKVNVAEMLEEEATQKGIDLNVGNFDTNEFSEDIVELSNDFDLDLQLSSDPESSDNENNRSMKVATTRKRRPAMTVKKNAKGETRLHEACISGNYQIAKMLIEQGHQINVRDNAGWLPLHEAAIHGFRDVVELLLDNGAQSAINDKGGTSCDGITPLYDAASNGNLSVVQLLLDRGAKSTVKTDFSETPLDALLRWHGDYGKNLSPTEEEFYMEIKQRLTEELKKIGIETAPKSSNTASSGYNSALSRPSLQKQSLRFETTFSEDSENEENCQETENIKRNARLEYKNAMKSLKAPKSDQNFNEKCAEAKRRSAHLARREIDIDDWLEDDLGPVRKKQKFVNQKATDGQSPAKKTPEKAFSRKTSSLLLELNSDGEKSDTSDVLDAFDVVMGADEHAGLNQKRRRNSVKSQSKVLNQPSLLDAGFSRFTTLSAVSPVKASTSSCSLNESGGQQPEKPIIIKVEVGDEKILVPVNTEAVNELQISWLSDEVARRYYW